MNFASRIKGLVRRIDQFITSINFIKPYWGFKEFSCGFLYNDGRNNDSLNSLVDKFRKKLKINGVIIPTSSGRNALELALRVLKNNRPTKQKVIIPTYGCRGIFDPIINTRLTPVFADIDYNLNISKDSVRRYLKKNNDVLAIVVPHLGGCKAEVAEIASIAKERDIIVIEDVCQALGGKDSNTYLGTRYDMSFFSFGIGKNLMATTGGILTSRILKENLCTEAKKLGREDTKLVKRRFRNIVYKYFGKLNQNINQYFLNAYKYNNLHPLDAKLISIQLDKLEIILKKRRDNAKKVISALYKTNYRFSLPNSKSHIYTKLSIIFENIIDRNKLEKNLRIAGIETEAMYTPLHLREFAINYPSINEKLPNSELRYKMVFNIPVRPNLTRWQLNKILNVIENANS